MLLQGPWLLVTFVTAIKFTIIAKVVIFKSVEIPCLFEHNLPAANDIALNLAGGLFSHSIRYGRITNSLVLVSVLQLISQIIVYNRGLDHI